MIEHLKGTLEYCGPNHVVIGVNGVGYSVQIPLTYLADLPPTGDLITLYTAQIVRENELALYGFFTRAERMFFERLITVSGIGPKTGLALLSKFPLERLYKAIQNEDSALISKAPGIGKKTAERLLLELGDKLPALPLSKPRSTLSLDAIQALTHLGYPEARAQKAIEAILEGSKNEPPLSELIRQALQCV